MSAAAGINVAVRALLIVLVLAMVLQHLRIARCELSTLGAMPRMEHALMNCTSIDDDDGDDDDNVWGDCGRAAAAVPPTQFEHTLMATTAALPQQSPQPAGNAGGGTWHKRATFEPAPSERKRRLDHFARVYAPRFTELAREKQSGWLPTAGLYPPPPPPPSQQTPLVPVAFDPHADTFARFC